MSTSVKYFHSAMVGAPVLNNAAGALIGLLDACLVNGFGVIGVSSVVVADGIATVVTSAAHPFEPDTVALMAGATPSGLNGEKRVLTTGVNTFTFDATGIPDQSATGTITTKLAGLGWSKVFSSTGHAAYRSNDVTGTRMFLRVADASVSVNASAYCYESMSDIDTGVNRWPNIGADRFWQKSGPTTATGARTWTLVGDGKRFFLHVLAGVPTASSVNGGVVHAFGDFIPTRAGDPFACLLSGPTGDLTSSTIETAFCFGYGTVGVGGSLALARSFTGLGQGTAGGFRPESYWTTSAYSGELGQAATYPNGPDNSLILSRVVISEVSPFSLRGRMPGIYYAAQAAQANFSWRHKIDGQGSLFGRKMLVVKVGPPNGAARGMVLFDVTGPWE